MTRAPVPPPERAGQSVTPAGCALVRLESFTDQRGSLAVAHSLPGLGFVATRVFVIYDVPEGARRGGHAHRTQDELLIAVSGSVTVDVDDGREQATLILDHPTLALHLPPGVWSAQRNFSPGACLLVLASGAYDPADHIGAPGSAPKGS